MGPEPLPEQTTYRELFALPKFQEPVMQCTFEAEAAPAIVCCMFAPGWTAGNYCDVINTSCCIGDVSCCTADACCCSGDASCRSGDAVLL